MDHSFRKLLCTSKWLFKHRRLKKLDKVLLTIIPPRKNKGTSRHIQFSLCYPALFWSGVMVFNIPIMFIMYAHTGRWMWCPSPQCTICITCRIQGGTQLSVRHDNAQTNSCKGTGEFQEKHLGTNSSQHSNRETINKIYWQFGLPIDTAYYSNKKNTTNTNNSDLGLSQILFALDGPMISLK